MSDLPPQITNWLYNVLQPQYINKQLSYTHICQFLSLHFNKNFRFKVRTSVYTSSSTGESGLLVNLFGSIPTKSGIYVPIEIWIPFNYPFGDPSSSTEGVPIVFVRPNAEIGTYLIPGNNVDGQGRFYHPYLSDWYHQFVPGNDARKFSRKYNLIVLTKILQENFDLELPVYNTKESSEVITNRINIDLSKAPRKPAKIALSKQRTLSPQSTGPPLPQKVPSEDTNNLSNISTCVGDISQTNIPHKYNSPLPLPYAVDTRSNLYHTLSTTAPAANIIDRLTPQQPVSRLFNNNGNNESEKDKNNIDRNITDLMDKFDTVSMEPLKDNNKKSILQYISERINACLTESHIYNENLNEKIPIINENSSKIGALYNQLSHHNKQAKANSENLESHIEYLTQQLNNLSSLNSNLIKLNEINSQDANRVTISENNNIDINDVIIPDSVQVKQLYETVSEIKAMKDAINLISGKFRSESEIINNDRLEICIRTVRGLGREIFWNELVKNELVSSITGLSK